MNSRRNVLSAGLAVVLGHATASATAASVRGTADEPPADDATLRDAFDQLSSTLNSGDVVGFLALFDDRAIVIDEDAPFRMSKAGFIDHLGFHGNGMWEGFAWVPRETRHLVRGNSGFSAGTVTFRGKPRDAGFRLRHMMHTITWSRTGGSWRVACFHQTPLSGHIDGASPGTGG